MSAPHSSATVEHLASRLDADHATLAALWLARLEQVIDVDRRDVFPTSQLLDHIPELIRQVAAYLRAPADEEVAANTAIMLKAAELGGLRFDQRASVHQLLREYQLLCEILEGFFVREAERLGPGGDPAAAVLAVSRAQRAVRVLQQQTVDAFVTLSTEALHAQTARLRNFSRLVSHEIRQPLGVLQVIARMLPVPEGDAEARRLTETLGRNVARLAEVAATLERLARLSRRPDNLPNEQEVDLVTVGRDVATQLAEMAAARGVRIRIDEDLPRLLTDAGQVELVLMNLIANAVKYSDPRKPHRLVHVRADRTVPYPGVRVEDNGIGIPHPRREEIFQQFVRLHAHLDETLGAQGMGLGLSIVRDCMEAMGGTITVETVEDVGTTFVLGWPAHPRRT